MLNFSNLNLQFFVLNKFHLITSCTSIHTNYINRNCVCAHTALRFSTVLHIRDINIHASPWKTASFLQSKMSHGRRNPPHSGGDCSPLGNLSIPRPLRPPTSPVPMAVRMAFWLAAIPCGPLGPDTIDISIRVSFNRRKCTVLFVSGCLLAEIRSLVSRIYSLTFLFDRFCYWIV